jgi:hypothetical protein
MSKKRYGVREEKRQEGLVGVGQAWWCTPVIPAFGRLRQEDQEFKTSLDYIERPPLSKRKKGKGSCSPFKGLDFILSVL